MKLIEIEIINIQTDCSLLKALKKEYNRLYYMRLLAKLIFLAVEIFEWLRTQISKLKQKLRQKSIRDLLQIFFKISLIFIDYFVVKHNLT